MGIKSFIKPVMIIAAVMFAFVNANIYVYAESGNAARYYDLGKEYEEKGDYSAACDSFEKSIPYAKSEGDLTILKHAAERVRQYRTVFDIYTLTGSVQKKYGAKNEPNGYLCGENSERYRMGESMMIVYFDYGVTSTWYVSNALQKAQSNGKAVVIALNFANETKLKQAVRP